MSGATGHTGAVTFLFSDIEGSTLLLRRLGDDFPDLVLDHRRLLRASWERRGGQELGTEGDSFAVAFAHAGSAIEAAVDAQRALLAHPWPDDARLRVRMGLHTGSATRRGNDYFGLSIHQAARVASTAHGGQIVVTDDTATAAAGLAEIGFMDLGLHRLKDLAAAVRLHQVRADGLEAEFPPIRSLTVMPNNFPHQASRFIGRDDDIAGVKEALARSSVMTLTGAGGVGKTRLALQVGADLIQDFPDGAWLVDLAPVTAPEAVARAAVQALGLREQPGREPLGTIVECLVAKRALVVLDNCEHLIDASAALAATVVAACPGVKVLATSRESLNIAGEVSWRLRSLAVPGHEAAESDLLGAEAVRLFLDRAAQVAPANPVSGAELAEVGHICRRLDGLPLAIELAAARIRTLSVAEIAARLDDRFRLLTGGSRVALPRQRTLEATVAWSYDLLNDVERDLFDHLAVFANGATIDAITAVWRGACDTDVLDLLDALVDRSLVVTDREDGATRYRLLETLRQFGRERLLASGAIDEARDRHLAWVLTVADSVPQMSGQVVSNGVAAEEDNFRVATEWATERNDAEAALRLVGAVWVGHFDERRDLYERMLPPADDVSPGVASRALFAGGGLSFMMAEWDAGAERMRLAAARSEDAGDTFLASMSLTYQAACEWGRGREAEARDLVDRALAIAGAADDRAAWCRAMMLVTWLEAEHDLDEAERLALAGMEQSRLLPDVFDLAHHHETHALVISERDGPLAAAISLADTLALFQEVQVNCAAHVLETAAAWAMMRGDPALAGDLWGSALRIRDETHDRPRPWEVRVQAHWLPAIVAGLTPDELTAAQARGRERDARSALAFAEQMVRASVVGTGTSSART